MQTNLYDEKPVSGRLRTWWSGWGRVRSQGAQGHFGAMDVFTVLSVVMVSWSSVYIETY